MKCARRTQRRSSRALWTVGAADIPLCFSNMADIVCTPTLPLFFIASSISFPFLRRIELHARSSNFRSIQIVHTANVSVIRSSYDPSRIVLKFTRLRITMFRKDQSLILFSNRRLFDSPLSNFYEIILYQYMINTRCCYLEMRSKCRAVDGTNADRFLRIYPYRISNIFLICPLER